MASSSRTIPAPCRGQVGRIRQRPVIDRKEVRQSLLSGEGLSSTTKQGLSRSCIFAAVFLRQKANCLCLHSPKKEDRRTQIKSRRRGNENRPTQTVRWIQETPRSSPMASSESQAGSASAEERWGGIVPPPNGRHIGSPNELLEKEK